VVEQGRLRSGIAVDVAEDHAACLRRRAPGDTILRIEAFEDLLPREHLAKRHHHAERNLHVGIEIIPAAVEARGRREMPAAGALHGREAHRSIFDAELLQDRLEDHRLLAARAELIVEDIVGTHRIAQVDPGIAREKSEPVVARPIARIAVVEARPDEPVRGNGESLRPRVRTAGTFADMGDGRIDSVDPCQLRPELLGKLGDRGLRAVGQLCGGRAEPEQAGERERRYAKDGQQPVWNLERHFKSEPRAVLPAMMNRFSANPRPATDRAREADNRRMNRYLSGITRRFRPRLRRRAGRRRAAHLHESAAGAMWCPTPAKEISR